MSWRPTWTCPATCTPGTAVRDGQARLLVRRESLDDIRDRDLGL
jgi:hypothetical protein